MRSHSIVRTTGHRAGLCSLAGVITGLMLTLLCTSAATAAEDPDPSLLGVSRTFIEANGYSATLRTSARGVNQAGSPQIPRSVASESEFAAVPVKTK